jgi:hypothetical protein
LRSYFLLGPYSSFRRSSTLVGKFKSLFTIDIATVSYHIIVHTLISMSSEYSELGSDDNRSNDDLEKVGFLSEVKCRSSRFDFFRGLWSLKTFATVLPWLLVIGLTLALTNRPKTLESRCAEFELDRYCMHASTFAFFDRVSHLYRLYSSGIDKLQHLHTMRSNIKMSFSSVALGPARTPTPSSRDGRRTRWIRHGTSHTRVSGLF